MEVNNQGSLNPPGCWAHTAPAGLCRQGWRRRCWGGRASPPWASPAESRQRLQAWVIRNHEWNSQVEHCQATKILPKRKKWLGEANFFSLVRLYLKCALVMSLPFFLSLSLSLSLSFCLSSNVWNAKKHKVDLEKQMVAVVSGSGGTSSLLCRAPNFSTSENLTKHHIYALLLTFRFQYRLFLLAQSPRLLHKHHILDWGNSSQKSLYQVWGATYLTTLIPSESASSTSRGFTSRTVTITFRQAGAELRMLRKFDCIFHVLGTVQFFVTKNLPRQRQLWFSSRTRRWQSHEHLDRGSRRGGRSPWNSNKGPAHKWGLLSCMLNSTFSLSLRYFPLVC